MVLILKIWSFIKKIDTKTLAFIAGALLVLFMMRQCNSISTLKSELGQQKELTEQNFNNYLAAKDSIVYLQNENGEQVAQISSFQFDINQLEKTNIDLQNKYVKTLGLSQDLKGVNMLLSADIKIKDSLLANTTVTSIDSLSGNINFTKSEQFSAGNSRNVFGNLIVRYDPILKSFSSSPTSLRIEQSASLVAAIERIDGRDRLKISSPYPGLNFTSIENINIIEDRLNKSEINKQSGFALGFGVGYGINLNPTNSQVTHGPTINVGLYWSPKWLKF